LSKAPRHHAELAQHNPELVARADADAIANTPKTDTNCHGYPTADTHSKKIFGFIFQSHFSPKQCLGSFSR
jgi:hypothetical protein